MASGEFVLHGKNPAGTKVWFLGNLGPFDSWTFDKKAAKRYQDRDVARREWAEWVASKGEPPVPRDWMKMEKT